MSLRRVVFPAPLLPMIPTVSPRRISRSMPHNASYSATLRRWRRTTSSFSESPLSMIMRQRTPMLSRRTTASDAASTAIRDVIGAAGEDEPPDQKHRGRNGKHDSEGGGRYYGVLDHRTTKGIHEERHGVECHEALHALRQNGAWIDHRRDEHPGYEQHLVQIGGVGEVDR